MYNILNLNQQLLPLCILVVFSVTFLEVIVVVIADIVTLQCGRCLNLGDLLADEKNVNTCTKRCMIEQEANDQYLLSPLLQNSGCKTFCKTVDKCVFCKEQGYCGDDELICPDLPTVSPTESPSFRPIDIQCPYAREFCYPCIERQCFYQGGGGQGGCGDCKPYQTYCDRKGLCEGAAKYTDCLDRIDRLCPLVDLPSEPPTTDVTRSAKPTAGPTSSPSDKPSAGPSVGPTTSSPSDKPTANPTASPTTLSPSEEPSAGPTTSSPSEGPSGGPTASPTSSPNEEPSGRPSTSPSAAKMTKKKKKSKSIKKSASKKKTKAGKKDRLRD